MSGITDLTMIWIDGGATVPFDEDNQETDHMAFGLTKEQSHLIGLGANRAGESVANFVIESACLRAEEVLASQRRFAYTAKQWDAFIAALDRPVQEKPRLMKLMTEPSVIE